MSPSFNRKNPFPATLLRQEPLTQAGSGKDTRHFVISLAGSGLEYLPGDSLGVFARNPPALVEQLLALLALDPLASVKDPRGAGTLSFRDALSQCYILNRASKKILSGLAERIPQGEQRNQLMEIADNGSMLSDYVETRDYVDILREFDEARFDTPADFLSQLSPIGTKPQAARDLLAFMQSPAAAPTIQKNGMTAA